MLSLFLLGLFSLIGLTAWNQVNSTFQGMDNDTISPEIKDKINGLSSYMNWGDKIFILVFLALFLGFLITSFTLPTNDSIFFVIYVLFLVFISLMGMVLSNSWHYLINNVNFIEAASQMTFTNWFMVYQPIIMFIIGIVGGLIFYSRKSSGPGDGRDIDFGSVGGEGL